MPASKVSHEVIVAAVIEWKLDRRGRTADDLAKEVGVSKSTLYKHANMAGVLITGGGAQPEFTARLARVEAMCEALMEAAGLEVPPVVTITALPTGIPKRVRATTKRGVAKAA